MRHPAVLISALVLLVSMEAIIMFSSKSPGGNIPFFNFSFNKEPVLVDSLKPGDVVSSPMALTGQAKGPWFFEGSLPVTVVDSDGNTVGEGYVQASSDWMIEGYVPFEGLVSFTIPAGSSGNNGTVIFSKDNPSGLPENDASVKIPITFK
jgi:hypothetical protein